MPNQLKILVACLPDSLALLQATQQQFVVVAWQHIFQLLFFILHFYYFSVFFFKNIFSMLLLLQT